MFDSRENPTAETFRKMDIKWSFMRWSLVGDNLLYIWDGHQKDHKAAAKALGFDHYDQFPFFLEDGNIVGSGIDQTKWVDIEDDPNAIYDLISRHKAMQDILSTGRYSIENLDIA